MLIGLHDITSNTYSWKGQHLMLNTIKWSNGHNDHNHLVQKSSLDAFALRFCLLTCATLAAGTETELALLHLQ